jgi:hypothetical protein
MGTDFMTLAIGAAIGAVACMALHKPDKMVMPVARTPKVSHGSNLDFSNAYVAFGHDEARTGYNNSEVWDTRDRLSFSDNLLYNKLPFIKLTSTTDWNPNNLDFSQAYGPPDADSPRPRLEHFLDSEIRAF